MTDHSDERHPPPGEPPPRRGLLSRGRLFGYLPEDGSAPQRPPLQGVAALGLAITALAILFLVFVAL